MEIDLKLFEKTSKSFHSHISLPENYRIIFSGKFGLGKSTFIESFFKEESEHYNYFHLRPVNYSVASNEDILSYMKYDILYEMTRKGVEFFDEDVSYLEAFPVFLKKNLHKIAANLLYMIPVVGKDLVEVFDRIDDLKNKFLDFHDKENLEASEKKTQQFYFDAIESKANGLYDSGEIIKLIESVLKRIKSDKKNVLVIDDLDRLDPEHVFRIFNVFSTHYENDKKSTNDNKFGFDSIVLVCDIGNVRNIFNNKYGADVDFSGYIDKFYSYDIFNYGDREAINSFSRKVLRSINVIDEHKQASPDLMKGEFVLNIITELVMNGFLNLRNVVKWHGRTYKLPSQRNVHDHIIKATPFPILNQMAFLSEVVGHQMILKDLISKISPDKMLVHHETLMKYVHQLVYIYCYATSSLGDPSFTFDVDGILYKASISVRHYNEISTIMKVRYDKDVGESSIGIIPSEVRFLFKKCLIKYLEYVA